MGDMLFLTIYLSRIKFRAFLLKLANKMQESPDRHRLLCTYRLNCTDTIYVKFK